MQVRSAPPPPPPPRKPRGPEPPDEFRSGAVETGFRMVGKTSQFVAMTPRVLETQKWILPTFNLSHMAPRIQFAAGLAGAVATTSLAVSGGLQMKEGVETHNCAELLAGASELFRGAYVGSWTAVRVTPWGPGLTALPTQFGVASGALQTAAGLLRLSHERVPGSRVNPKVVGLIEAGMGLTWMGSMLGVAPGACTVLRAALVVSKTGYTHRDKLGLWKDRTQKP